VALSVIIALPQAPGASAAPAFAPQENVGAAPQENRAGDSRHYGSKYQMFGLK
jgi:hypothetical protein